MYYIIYFNSKSFHQDGQAIFCKFNRFLALTLADDIILHLLSNNMQNLKYIEIESTL
jgi:hypothetical protein